VDLAFGDGDPLENAQRVLLHKMRQLAVFDQPANLAVAASMRVAVVVMVMLTDLATVVVVALFVFVMMMPVRVLAFVGVVMGVTVSMVMLLMSMRVFFRRLMMMLVGMRMAMLFSLVMVVMAVLVSVFMRLILVVRVDRSLVNAKLYPLHVLPFLAVEVHVKIAEIELGEFPLEGGGLDAEIDEGADCHVAADAGKTIEEEDFHERERMADARCWRKWSATPQVLAASRRHRKAPCR
jgi:hypothetical protein